MIKFIAVFTLLVGVLGVGTALAADAQDKPAYAPVIRVYNLGVDDLKALNDAAGVEGLKLQNAAADDPLGTPAVVLWEVSHAAEPDAARVNEIGEYVRQGGRLVLTLDAAGHGGMAFQVA